MVELEKEENKKESKKKNTKKANIPQESKSENLSICGVRPDCILVGEPKHA